MSRCSFKSELDKSDESRSPASRHFLSFITAVLFNDERLTKVRVCVQEGTLTW